MSASENEYQLIRAAKQGDKQAFAVLYQNNIRQLYRYIYLRVNNSEVAEDMTSDVFVRAMETLPNYQQGKVPFLGWLYHIAHGQIVDYYRRQNRRKEDQPIEDVDLVEEANAEQQALENIQQTQLLAHIQELTAEQQQVIMLRFIQGYNLHETAELMGKKVNAIKALQFRALRTLAQRFDVVIEEGEAGE